MNILNIFTQDDFELISQIHWNKSSYYKASSVKELESLPSKKELVSLINGGFHKSNWVQPMPVNINASKIEPPQPTVQHFNITPSQAHYYYGQGFTLCFGDMSNAIPKIKNLKKSAGVFFEHSNLIMITGYLSPPNSIGVLHFDSQHNIFIQREGIKKWIISQIPAVHSPYDNLIYSGVTEAFLKNMSKAGYDIKTPSQCGKHEVSLEPGDILYLPPGFYHVPETLNEPSLHYTLTIESQSFWKKNNELLFNMLLMNCETLNRDTRFMNASELDVHLQECNQIISKNYKNCD
jgi:ribosomal protein L16 Arg81 hydroxylase